MTPSSSRSASSSSSPNRTTSPVKLDPFIAASGSRSSLVTRRTRRRCSARRLRPPTAPSSRAGGNTPSPQSLASRGSRALSFRENDSRVGELPRPVQRHVMARVKFHEAAIRKRLDHLLGDVFRQDVGARSAYHERRAPDRRERVPPILGRHAPAHDPLERGGIPAPHELAVLLAEGEREPILVDRVRVTRRGLFEVRARLAAISEPRGPTGQESLRTLGAGGQRLGARVDDDEGAYA